MVASDIIEYLSLVKENFVATMYRGHSDINFALIPSIARYSKYVQSGFDSISGIEDQLLLEFEKFGVPIRDLRRASLIEKLVHAQHYGLPTRLLDWSSNPLKALYFAVEDPAFDNVNGSVIFFSPLHWQEGTSSIKEIDSITAFYPELLNERINSQEGCFTAFPLPKDRFDVPELDPENYPGDVELLVEVEIPGSAKKGLRIELNQLGVNHRTIYPGIDGVARWVKSHIAGYAI